MNYVKQMFVKFTVISVSHVKNKQTNKQLQTEQRENGIIITRIIFIPRHICDRIIVDSYWAQLIHLQKESVFRCWVFFETGKTLINTHCAQKRLELDKCTGTFVKIKNKVNNSNYLLFSISVEGSLITFSFAIPGCENQLVFTTVNNE